MTARSKYGARKVTIEERDPHTGEVVNVLTFDSAGEANRWRQLQLLAKAGVIRGLGEPHPVFPITINGTVVCKVEMDFAYNEGGLSVCEDYKGVETPMSRLKRKLLAAAYPHLTIKVTGPGAPKPLRAAKRASKGSAR